MRQTRIVLADDDVLFREGMASLLAEAGFQVVGRAGAAAELIELVRGHHPDLVIVDVRMPPDQTTEGLRAARVIRGESPQTAILVLSAHAEVEHAIELLDSGPGIGYLLKSRVTNVDEFIDALGRVARGGTVVDPAVVRELVSIGRHHDPLDALSAREREVLALMAEGLSNAAISRQLWVTHSTVEKHIRSIMMKLDVPDTDDDNRRVRAVVLFLETR